MVRDVFGELSSAIGFTLWLWQKLLEATLLYPRKECIDTTQNASTRCADRESLRINANSKAIIIK